MWPPPFDFHHSRSIFIILTGTRLVALQQFIPISLRYGSAGEFSAEVDADRVAVFRPGPAPRTDVVAAVSQALASPLDLPTLDQALVPDDKVVIALDRDTPGAAEVVAGIWSYLERRDIAPTNVTIIQPVAVGAKAAADPRSLLPISVQQAVTWKVHDPLAEDSCGYLATTTKGEAVYLAKELVDADFVLPVGAMSYDPLLGYRGTNSVLYPGLSNIEALRKTVGQGHLEISHREERPLRQLVDEIAWLMGVQFCVQVVASDGGGVLEVLAGSTDAVFKRSCQKLDDNWLVTMPERVETVIVAVSTDVSGHGWNQIGKAVATARQLVERGGRIVILSELDEQPGDGLSLLRREDYPENCLQLLRDESPVDLIPATQIVNAAGWARILLLSKLEPELVEELFIYPLEASSEVTRVLDASESCAILGGAQHTFGIVE